MVRSAAGWVATSLALTLFTGNSPGVVDGHVYLMEPVSRNFYYTTAFQEGGFADMTYCPHCYQSRGPMNVRQRAEDNTPSDILNEYGGGDWPHRAAYDANKLASNGNYLEPEEISVRHGICGDPEQTAAEGTNTFGKDNSVYPVLQTYEEGSVIEMKVVVSTFHWGHLEYFICNTNDLSDGEGSPVTQECFNMHPLNRVPDDTDASPIDPFHPGRYFLDPPCRAAETDQTAPTGATAGYVVTGRFQLPDGLSCERCVVQMVYYTGNSCRHPGYEEFRPASLPDGCAPTFSDWIHLDPPPCGVGAPYPEEFWNCADIAITPRDVNPCFDSTSSDYRCSGRTIDLRGCDLTDKDTTAMRTCFETAQSRVSRLRRIFLRGNDFTTLPDSVFSGMTGLTRLDLRSNCNLECVPTLPSSTADINLNNCNDNAIDNECGATPEPTPAPSPAITLPPIPSPVDDDDVDCSIVVGGYAQCGGENWAGPTCCNEGYACEALGSSYSQCRPVPDPDCSFQWEQCGGSGWAGPTCCWIGSSCEVQNTGYSQCIPKQNLSICSTIVISI